MLNERITLSPEEIYEKEFKIDARGYRPQEVDNFLDIVIRDYTEFIKVIKSYEKELGAMNSENAKLKQQIRDLEMRLDTQNSDSEEGTSNVDLLRRISQLEKFVYGTRNK